MGAFESHHTIHLLGIYNTPTGNWEESCEVKDEQFCTTCAVF